MSLITLRAFTPEVAAKLIMLFVNDSTSSAVAPKPLTSALVNSPASWALIPVAFAINDVFFIKSDVTNSALPNESTKALACLPASPRFIPKAYRPDVASTTLF